MNRGNGGKQAVNGGEKGGEREKRRMEGMEMETVRLRMRVASDGEMELLIAAQEDEGLRSAYGEMLQGCREHPEQRVWHAVWMIEKKDGTHVGDLSFKGLGADGVAEIGYGILEEYRGNGYAAEAVEAAVEWALRQPGVRRVEAETEAGNAASRRVLEKCGFAATGRVGEEGPRFSREIQAKG